MAENQLDKLEPAEDIVDLDDQAQPQVPILLDYLPGVFQQEGGRKHSPLWALLLLMEENFFGVSDTVDNIETFFDVCTTPTLTARNDRDFLEWLGSWVAFIPIKGWSQQKKRFVVSQATDLHKYRGTPTGLRYMINLFFEIDVEIKEWVWPKGMIIGERNTIGVDTCLHERVNLNVGFVVIWKPGPADMGPEFRSKVENIRALIDKEKPAHTRCFFHIDQNDTNMIKKS